VGFLNNFLIGRELEINCIIEISTMTTEPSSSFPLYFIYFFIAYKRQALDNNTVFTSASQSIPCNMLSVLGNLPREYDIYDIAAMLLYIARSAHHAKVHS
jgi:hypothetical protein